MRPKKALQIMKENGRKGWLKKWYRKGEPHSLWTEGRCLFYNTLDFTEYPPGYYKLSGKTLIPVQKKDFPPIPKFPRKGYHKAKLPYDNDGRINILYSLDGTPDLVNIKASKQSVYIDFKYFAYIYRHTVNNWTVWKVKDGQSPVLVFYEKKLKGAIMPFKYKRG